MSKKLPVILGVIWLLAATVIYGSCLWQEQPDGVYTYENDGCTIDQKVYVADNEKTEGILYGMDLYGKVSDVFSTRELGKYEKICNVAAYDGQLYAVAAEYDNGQSAVRDYRIIQFSQGLRMTAMTGALYIYEGDQVTDLIINETGMYLATVSSSQDAACVYEVPMQQLLDLETAQTASLELESFLRQEAGAGQRFVQASYEMDQICVRTDTDLVSGPFALDDSIRYTYSLCHLNLGQLMSLHGSYQIIFLAAVAAGWLLIALLYFLLHNRNRVVYVAFVLELLLLVVVLGGSGVLIYKQVQLEKDTKTKWLSTVMVDVCQGMPQDLSVTADDFYTSDQYTQVCRLLDTAYNQTLADGCQDLFVADTADYRIYASASRHNQELVDARYFAQGVMENDRLVTENNMTEYTIRLNGQKYQLLAVSVSGMADQGYALFGVYLDDSWNVKNWQSELVTALIIFALASLICLFIVLIQASDLSEFAHGMQLVANGRTDVERPHVYGKDMRILWSSLAEIQKKIRKVNYSKFLAFEAYYRFAPKNIERLLNKESITEVVSGNVTKLTGTMAMISTVGPRSGSEEEIGRLNRLIALIGRYQEERDGVLVSNDGAMSILRFLFMEKNKDTLNCSVDFLRELKEQEVQYTGKYKTAFPRTAILLHYSSFVYGVAGTNQQSSTFLVSRETDEIEHFAAWFREHGLGLVISETVREREHYDGRLRCIGYIQMSGSEKKMQMYEVLDALDVRERDRKLAICDRFAQALELFYQHDFYLARSVFSDILKELPTDEISKWYLFTCENYLNMENAEDVMCALRYDE